MILGHQIQGDWIADDGSTYQPVTVYFELLRLWDSRAVWHKMLTDAKALEANIRYAERVGAEVMFTFGEPPESVWVSPDEKRPRPKEWSAFVESTVRQAAGRIKYWELWNEPAIPGYWDGTPEELAEQSRIGYQIIKLLQPDAIVLSPSFTEVELPRGRAFIRRYVAAGGLKYCDAVAWHGYCEHSADLRGQISALKSFTALPLYNTEYVVGTGLSQMLDSLMLQSSQGIVCAVWNAEIPGSEDYTDPTMDEAYKLLSAPQPLPDPARKGCNPFARFF